MQKDLLRKEIFQRLSELSAEDVFDKSEIIFQKISEDTIILNHNVFLLFVSIQKEFRTEKLIDFLLKNQKKVLIPKVINDQDMVVIDITTKEIYPWSIDVAYIPGIVFGKDKNRIGRGKGYYDRFLSNNNIKRKIWIWFDIQLVDTIPVDSHDQKMDGILTESYWIK